MPPKQHAGLVAHRNDDHRIGAREMVRAARRAMPPVARVAHLRLGPAIGAEPVVRMPMQQRTGLRQEGQFALRQRSRRGKAAQVHEAFLRLHRAGKPPAAQGIDAEEHAFRRARRSE